MIGTLGNVVFSVSSNRVLTPTGISGTSGSDWGSHDVVHGKVRSEWVAESANAYYFVLGGQPMADNPFKITSLSDEWGAVLHGGALIECKVSVELEEYL